MGGEGDGKEGGGGEGDGRGGSSQDMQSFPLWGIGAKYALAEDEVVTYHVSQFNQIGNSPTLPHCFTKMFNVNHS